MSSFIHSKTHFNSIAAALPAMLADSNFHLKPELRAFFPEATRGFDSPQVFTDVVKELIDATIHLNAATVLAQYEGYEVPYNTFKAHYKSMLKAKGRIVPIINWVDMYRAISSLTYQIEIDQLDRPLTEKEAMCFKFLETLESAFEYNIVTRSKEYRESPFWEV